MPAIDVSLLFPNSMMAGAIKRGQSRFRSMQGAGSAVTPTTITWSPTDKNSFITLSNNNLTANATQSGGGVRATQGQNIGLYYFETTAAGTNSALGLALSTYALNGGPVGAGFAGIQYSGQAWINGSQVGSPLSGVTVGSVIGIAVDLNAKLIWFRKAPSGNWNNNGAADPIAAVGGLSIAAINGTLVPYFYSGSNTDVSTANFGATAYSGVKPTGYANWPATLVPSPAAITPTTWNPADKTASMGLSASNLIATPSGANSGVRAISNKSSGKYYFEYVSVTSSQVNDFYGLIQPALALPKIASAAGTTGLNGLTVPYVNGSSPQGGAIGSGPTFLYIAVDLDNDLIWFKCNSTSGSLWNAGSANPATGVGGYSLASLSTQPLAPYCGFVTTGTALTANFGATAFAGFVPFGFTAGWPA